MSEDKEYTLTTTELNMELLLASIYYAIDEAPQEEPYKTKFLQDHYALIALLESVLGIKRP